MFLPFSKDAKLWEPHAMKLRGLVDCVSGQTSFDPFKLAPKVGLSVCELNLSALSADEQRHLRGVGKQKWSGGIYPVPLADGSSLCILNPDQSPGRQRITLMEEICHLYFNHVPTKLLASNNGVSARDYNTAQEKEAYGVGSAVLLPWTIFYHRLDKGVPIELIAEEFEVTSQLVQYRIKTSGGSSLYFSRTKRLSRAASG